MKPINKLSFTEQIVLSILQENKKGTLNTQRVFSRIPETSSISKEAVYDALLSLTQKKHIIQASKGQFQLVKPEKVVRARVIVNFAGEFLLKTPEDEIMRIGQHYFAKSLPEDIVDVYYKKNGKRTEISQIKVIQREPRKIIGFLDVFNGHAFLLTGNTGYKDIQILGEVDGEFDGQKAQVLVTDFPENSKYPIGELLSILGKPGVHETEMHSIVAEFGFQSHFPQDVINESEEIPDTIPQEEIKKRKDFRSVKTFTIDPEDAKDFDDAISLEYLSDNSFKIGVHIADVSHYVLMDSPLDKEALNRSTSVYLVDRTIPMLPEKLSNNLCSLRPNEDRLSFSVEFTFSADYNLLDTWIGKGIIHSDRRFSYEDAQERIVNNSGDYAEDLIFLNTIAKHFEELRFKNGALKFESRELRFILDEKDLPTKVIEKVRFDSHKLIETYMLMANQAVAEYVYKLKVPAPAFIYRTHDEPPKDKLIEFAKFSKLLGYPINIENERSLRKSFNSLLERTAGKPEADMLQQMSIRTMAKAVYTSQKTSHFGLAFQFYSHFTSPIRRYPDLLAHRILFEYLKKRPTEYTESHVEAIAKHSSTMEQKASDAERASIKYKLAELMHLHEGETFEARVSGITEWGIYATIFEYHAEGMIRLNDIRFEQFRYIDSERKIIGKRSKKSISLGDVITVKVKKANPLNRTIDLILIDF